MWHSGGLDEELGNKLWGGGQNPTSFISLGLGHPSDDTRLKGLMGGGCYTSVWVTEQFSYRTRQKNHNPCGGQGQNYQCE